MTGMRTPTSGQMAAAGRRSLTAPRTWGVRPGDLAYLAVGNAALIVGMWIRHGQVPDLRNLGAVLTGAGQLTALLGTYTALIQVVLMSRSPWLDQLFGIDRITGWHRWLGFATVWLILGHVVLTTTGFALGDGSSVAAESWTFITTYPFVLMAYVGTALFVLVAVTSVRAARRRLRHETWHFIHLYIYVAIALSFGHQLLVGTDFERDPIAVAYWIGLYVATALSVIGFRLVRPARLAMRHRLRIGGIVEEAPGVLSIYITGRDLPSLSVRAGQFFKFRFITPTLWWRVHPFSLSAAPNGQHLRITVKEIGDFTGALRTLHPSTRVLVEGPYGIFTHARRRYPRALLIAGGIGITPLRALLEEMPQRRNGVTLLYRASSWADVVFKAELDHLVARVGGVIHYIVGRRGYEVHPEPFAPGFLLAMAPDLRERDIFVCGPREMIDSVSRALRALHVPDSQVHAERFAFL